MEARVCFRLPSDSICMSKAKELTMKAVAAPLADIDLLGHTHTHMAAKQQHFASLHITGLNNKRAAMLVNSCVSLGRANLSSNPEMAATCVS